MNLLYILSVIYFELPWKIRIKINEIHGLLEILHGF